MIQGARIVDFSKHPIRNRNREQPNPMGRRVRLTQDPKWRKYWIQQALAHGERPEWTPTHGMTGTVVDTPAPDILGSGLKIRWDNGRETWLGCTQTIEFIDQP